MNNTRCLSRSAQLLLTGLSLLAAGHGLQAQGVVTDWLPTGSGDFMLDDNWSDNVPQIGGYGNTGFFTINNGGEAQLSVSHELFGGRIGEASGQSGTLTLQTGSDLRMSRNDLEDDIYGTVYVGVAGQGTLNLSGGTLSAVDLRVASQSGGTGTVVFSGGAINLTGVLYLGDGGTGTLTQTVGVSTIATTVIGAAGTGTYNASGGELAIDSLVVGQAGQGTLSVTGTATLQTSNTVVGENSGADGTVALNATTWTNTGNLTVGSAGSGNLTVENGASLTVNGDLTLTGASGGSGTFSLDGSTLTVDQTITIGEYGNGSATISGGSTVVADAIVVSGESPAPSSTFTVADSTIQSGQIAGMDNATVTFTDSTVRATQSNAAYFIGLDEIRLEGTSFTFDTQEYDISTSAALIGSARLIKTGTGSLGLGGASFYSGGTYLQSGEISINNGNALGLGGLEMDTAELNATASLTVSSSELTVNANQTATFSAAGSTTLTLDFEMLHFGDDASLTFGSAGNTGTVIFGADFVEASLGGTGTLNLQSGNLTAADTTLGTLVSRMDKVIVQNNSVLDFNDQSTSITVGVIEGDGVFVTGQNVTTNVTVLSGDFGGQFITTGNLVKEGSGTLIFSGSPQASGGILVQEGTVLLNGAAGSDVFINGGNLGGIGSADVVALESGTLNPGEDGSIGTFSADSLVWIDGDLAFDLGATSGVSDQIALAEMLAGEGTTYRFIFSLDSAAVVENTYTLITFGSQTISITDFIVGNTDGVAGTFAYNGNSLEFTLTAVPEPGTVVLIGMGLLLVAYNGNSLEFTLTAVPEPGTVVLIGMGLLLVAILHRRRRVSHA